MYQVFFSIVGTEPDKILSLFSFLDLLFIALLFLKFKSANVSLKH